MSLRLRLTLWYSALLAILLLLIIVITLSGVRASVQGDIDSDLSDTANQIAALVEMRAQTGTIMNAAVGAITPVLGPNTYAQLRSVNRRVLYRSSNLVNQVILLPDRYYEQAMQGKSGFYSLSGESGGFRVYFTPIKLGGETIAIVQMGRSLQTEQGILNSLVLNLLVLSLAALAIAAGVGYWIAGAALRPIGEATNTALEITRTGRLDRRVPVHGPPTDEVGRLIATFNEMLARIESLFLKQKRFSADVSHELRTPLTAILGNISLLKRSHKLPPAEQFDMLAEIEGEADRMRRLVSDLLLLAQADADLVLAHDQVELDTLLLEVYRQARRQSSQHEIRLLHEDQAIVLGDADRLRQVFVNLVNNAIQYTPAGGRIDLSLTCRGDYAEITVADTGQGIAPEDLPYIFDRFYRADKARSHAAGGTGLGLSIVKWVVDAHHGEISVQSRAGFGATFSVRLPLAAGCGETATDETVAAPEA